MQEKGRRGARHGPDRLRGRTGRHRPEPWPGEVQQANRAGAAHRWNELNIPKEAREQAVAYYTERMGFVPADRVRDVGVFMRAPGDTDHHAASWPPGRFIHAPCGGRVEFASDMDRVDDSYGPRDHTETPSHTIFAPKSSREEQSQLDGARR